MSKIVVDTVESSGTTVTVNDNLSAGTNAVTAGSITGLTATSLTSGTLNLSTVTLSGAIPAAVTFAGAKAPTVYYKNQSTLESSYAGGTTYVATGHGFYHAFASGKTYIVAFDLNTYNLANGYEGNCWGIQQLYTDSGSTTIPASGTTTLPGTSQTITLDGNLGMNGQGATNGSYAVGNYAMHTTLPFAGTGTTDVMYLTVRTYNTNVTGITKGVKWYVYEYDTAPATTTG